MADYPMTILKLFLTSLRLLDYVADAWDYALVGIGTAGIVYCLPQPYHPYLYVLVSLSLLLIWAWFDALETKV